MEAEESSARPAGQCECRACWLGSRYASLSKHPPAAASNDACRGAEWRVGGLSGTKRRVQGGRMDGKRRALIASNSSNLEESWGGVRRAIKQRCSSRVVAMG
jgi:hypothetical protein